MLVDHLVINGVLTPFRCSDTVFYKDVVNKSTEQEEIISFFDAHISAKNEIILWEDAGYKQSDSLLLREENIEIINTVNEILELK